jgi:phosphate transport system substrate-binding protein
VLGLDKPLALALALAGLLVGGAALAVPGGKVLFYGGAGQGKVIFDGRTHASAGLACKDCHSALFATKKQALITLADHDSPRACFGCHDGQKAFHACGGCHRRL